MPKTRILVVDDEESPREALRFILKDRYEVVLRPDAASGLEALADHGPFDAMLLDMKMPGMSGLEALPRIRELDPNLPVVMATAISDARSAVQAMKAGAADYLNKPFGVDEIRQTIERVLKERALRQEAPASPAVADGKITFDEIIGSGPAMQKVYTLLRRLVDNDCTVLILGETGTGKELVARALHYNSSRRAGPFVAVHCAAIPGELLESELFGHEKGSFTGAHQRRVGMFEAANGGTLFLDEVGEMPLGTQTKLLRAIQEREVRRVGSQDTVRVNVRLVCATNRDLEAEVRKGAFREDLFYRINVVPVDLPPLRARREDIPVLALHFLQRFAKDLGRAVAPEISPMAMELLLNYGWPGNIRELEHAIERVLVMNDAPRLEPEHLPLTITKADNAAAAASTHLPVQTPRAILGGQPAFDESGLDLPKLTESIERQAIEEALRRTNGIMTEAARSLHITRRMLRYKMDKLGIATRNGAGDEGGDDEIAGGTLGTAALTDQGL